MLNINDLPEIKLEGIAEEVDNLLINKAFDFKMMAEAPILIKVFSKFFNEDYIAYKTTIYAHHGHISLAKSQNESDRIIATSKILPWVYIIKNNRCSNILTLLHTLSNTMIRSYYFLYEYAILQSHTIDKDVSELIAMGFVSSRKNIVGMRKNPDKLLETIRTLLQTKITKPINQ